VKRFLLLIAATAGLCGCTSPESTRSRAGGPGADTGNRGETVRMHEGSKPYAGTPRIIPAEGPPLDPAQHAYQRSRP
jgi:hypothetical protein